MTMTPAQGRHALESAAVKALREKLTAASGKPPLTAATAPRWLGEAVRTAFSTWNAGRAARCRHRPAPAAPEPLVAAFSRPELVTCIRDECRRMTLAAVRCDACQRRRPAEQLGHMQVQYRFLLLVVTMCQDCAAAGRAPDVEQAARRRDGRRGHGHGSEGTVR